MKEFFSITRRIYDFRIIVFLLFIFITLKFLPIGFIPDYLSISEEVATNRIILTFISSLTGFLSLILAVFIVFYNFYSQSIRRNAVNYILNNIWLKRLISFYLGTIAFLLLTYFSIEEPLNNNDLNLIYFSIVLFVAFIVFAFPVIMLSIKYSSSLYRIKDLISLISIQTIEELNYNDFDEKLDWSFKFERLESNNLILIKDIGIDAINKNDWILPQNIVIELYERLIKSIEKEVNEIEVKKRIDGFLFVIDHFNNSIVKNGDFITTNIIIDHLFVMHSDLNKIPIHLTQFKSINNTTKRLFRLLIESKIIFNIQTPLIKYAYEIIIIDFKSFKENDEELLLSNYVIEKEIHRTWPTNKSVNAKWQYLLNDVSGIFFYLVSYSIEAKNMYVYDRFDWVFRKLLSRIIMLDNLTEYQKEEILEKFYSEGMRLIDLLIENKIYKNHSLYATHDIISWFNNNERFAMKALLFYTLFISKIKDLNVINIRLLSDFFQIINFLIESNSPQKITAINTTLNSIRSLYDETEKNSEIREEIVSYLERLSKMVKKSDDEEIKSIFKQKTKGIKLNKD